MLEQIKHVLSAMPSGTVLERRNRALIAFTTLTGARDSAIASMKLKHVDLTEGAFTRMRATLERESAKTFVTYYFPVGDEIKGIVEDSILFLKTEELWGMDDPLFPATRMTLSAGHEFEASDSNAFTGRLRRPFGGFSVTRLNMPDYRASIRIALEAPSLGSVKSYVEILRPSKHGVKTWVMSRY